MVQACGGRVHARTYGHVRHWVPSGDAGPRQLRVEHAMLKACRRDIRDGHAITAREPAESTRPTSG